MAREPLVPSHLINTHEDTYYLEGVFLKTEVLFLMKFNFLFSSAFCVLRKPLSRSQRFSFRFSSRGFLILAFTFRAILFIFEAYGLLKHEYLQGRVIEIADTFH